MLKKFWLVLATTLVLGLIGDALQARASDSGMGLIHILWLWFSGVISAAIAYVIIKD